MIRVISEYLRTSAKHFPDKIVLVDKEKSIKYCEALETAENIAGNLITEGMFKQPIAVMMDKGADAVVVFWGVAVSGNFYTVIDTKMPDVRIQKILATFLPKIIITDLKNLSSVKRLCMSLDIKILIYEEVCQFYADKKLIQSVEKRIIDTDILYVLFTSGTTGIPKGVIINHRSVIDYIEWATEVFHFSSDTIFGNQAPFYFDNSVLDIYATLKNGAMLHIIPKMLYSFPIRLLEYIRDHKVNTVFWVPTVLTRVADMGVLDCCDISCLKNVLFAGEVMPAKQLNIWIRKLPNVLFANLYGPTEITVDCTYYIIDRRIEDDESVPIGYPCRNSDILVLNQENQLADMGEKGELCVRGTSLSLGYYNNPEKTAMSFVQNPLNNMYEEKIYRTGDMVHYNERGEIIYDGRMDSQIKHSGHRIELGEIETAVSSIKGIQTNCCIHKAAEDQIVLFYTGAIEPREVRENLTILLPEYMLPNTYKKLVHMPLNMNGKIDRIKLKNELDIVDR